MRESSLAPYTEATWSPIDKLRLMGGLRADYYSLRRALEAGWTIRAATATAHIFSPKAGAAYALNGNVELYANWGRGFHSNDARGVVAPLEGNDPVPGSRARHAAKSSACASSKATSR